MCYSKAFDKVHRALDRGPTFAVEDEVIDRSQEKGSKYIRKQSTQKNMLQEAFDENPTNVVMTPWTILKASILMAGNEKLARVAAMKWVFILSLLLGEPTQS